MRAAVIGNFDGVHRGHLHLIDYLKAEAAKLHLQPVVITFSSHSLQLINVQNAPKLLTLPCRRNSLLQACNVEVIELDFSPELRAMSAEEFLGFIRREFQVELLIMGFNNRIGSDRISALDPQMATAALRARVRVLIAPEFGDESVSSSTIREALADGDVEKAARLLGRPYAIEGVVVTGRQLGRTLGFPTANILPDARTLIPAPGVYMAKTLDHKAVVNIGHRPTVEGRDDAPLSIEAYLLDFKGDLYGQTLCLEFFHKIRGEKCFSSFDELKQAIASDVTTTYERDF